MFSVGRLVLVAAVGSAVYALFFSTPAGGRAAGAFDPARVAASEVAVWQAAHVREDFGTFINGVHMLRELHRYSWFRAAQASYYQMRATTTFAGLRGRYERVLPDLEQVAAIQRAWTDAGFDPAAVSRAELNWWVTRRMPNLNTIDQLAPLVADELALRYEVSDLALAAVAHRRAEAVLLFDATAADPDTVAIERMLTESYGALRQAIEARRTP